MSNTDEIKPVVDEAPAKGLGQTTFLGYCVPGSSYVLHTTEGPQPLPKALLANLQAAVLVAMVSLSLSIGLGIASNSGPIEGLRTAIWGGIVSGVFGSSPWNIIGPAGALTGMLSTYSDKWTPEILPWIAMISGLFSLVVLGLGLQRYMLFMPKSVFEGFTTAVGLIIGLKQVNNAFGMYGLTKRDSFLENLWESISNLDQAEPGSYALFFPELIVMYVLMRYIPAYKTKTTDITLPWMVVIPLGTIFLGYARDEDTTAYFASNGTAEASEFGWVLPTLKTRYGSLDASLISLPKWEVVEACDDKLGLIMAGLSVCIVAVLETVISAKIAEIRCFSDGRENQRGDFKEGQELLAMSGGQLLSGLFGGLPSTGVFVRTSVNFTNGGNHPLSQLVNALLVLAVTAVAMPAFELLPMASVAAVLVLSAVRMVPFAYIVGLWKSDRAHFILCVATAILCTVLDMIVGLLAGTFLGFLVNAMRTCQVDIAVIKRQPAFDDKVRSVKLAGPYCYSNAEASSRRAIELFESKAKGNTVPTVWVLELTSVIDVDLDGADSLKKLMTALEKKAADHNVSSVLILDELSIDHYSGDQPALAQLSSAAWFNKLRDSKDKADDQLAVQGRRVFDSQKALIDAIGNV